FMFVKDKGGKLKRIKDISDVVLGGRLTQRKIDKNQEDLDKKIDKFNRLFGERELTPSEFEKANRISFDLNNQQSNIDKRQAKLFGSKRFTIPESITLIKRKPLSESEIKKGTTRNERELVKLEEKRKNTKGSLNKKRLDIVIKIQKQKIKDIKEGVTPTLFAGSLPLIPRAGIPSGVLRVFLSADVRIKKGKIITDLIFETSKGQVGFSKGVTLTKGEKGFSFIAGRSGRLALKFPSGKGRVISTRTFIGGDVTKSTEGIIKTLTEIGKFKKLEPQSVKLTEGLKRLLKKQNTLRKRLSGRISKLNAENIRRRLRLLTTRRLNLERNARRLIRKSKKLKPLGKITRGRRPIKIPTRKIKELDLQKNLKRLLKEKGKILKRRKTLGKTTRGRRPVKIKEIKFLKKKELTLDQDIARVRKLQKQIRFLRKLGTRKSLRKLKIRKRGRLSRALEKQRAEARVTQDLVRRRKAIERLRKRGIL
ncbi:hypothetical protein LCGC14_2555830, partial [marine sediment metagenome]